MKKLLTIFGIVTILLSGCGKKESKDSINAVEELEVKNIVWKEANLIVNQRISFMPLLADTTGNIVYEWKIFFGDEQIGETLTGPTFKNIFFRPENVGDYTVKLKIKKDNFISPPYEKAFMVVIPNFQTGIWGDSEETILTMEAADRNLVFKGEVTVPEVFENNTGLTTLTYFKVDRYYTYYFKDNRLYAGAFTQTWDYVNENTDLRIAYNSYINEKGNLKKQLGREVEERKIWRIAPDQIVYWDNKISTRSQAIGLDYLRLRTFSKSVYGRGTVELYKQSATKILLQYVLISNG
ncbi:MAG: hypothetical protein ACOH2A_06080 [Sphingobacteriaceae bacterium]